MVFWSLEQCNFMGSTLILHQYDVFM